MSDILICGMEMPETGIYILSVDKTDADATIFTVSEQTNSGKIIPKHVGKAVTIQPHRRLGDLDKISNLLKDRIAENDKWILEFCAHGDSKSVNELYDENAILERVISLLKYDSRTIIPAEGGDAT